MTGAMARWCMVQGDGSQPMLLPRHLTSVAATQRSQQPGKQAGRQAAEATLAHGVTMMNDH